MKLKTVLTVLLVVVGAAICVRLGFWQLSRWHQKQALNAALESALKQPARPVDAETPMEAVSGRTIEARGRYDERRQILLAGRTHDGSPGVEVVTPLVQGNGETAILVDRGWLYSGDAAWARPQEYPEPGARVVRGLAEPLRHGAGGAPLVRRDVDSVALLSSRWLDRDSLAARLPYRLAGFALRELPGPGVGEKPARTVPHPANEAMHLSYAVQWFLFAVILVGGTAIVARSRARRDSSTA